MNLQAHSPLGARSMRWLCAWAVLGATASAGAQSSGTINYDTARFERRLLATRASGEITLDGSLDEAAWQEAPVASGFLQNEPREGQPATFDTEVRVLYDAQGLYVGVFARD